jgi:hypothetical protein
MNGSRWPAHYEIRIEEALDGHWSAWFDDLQVTGDDVSGDEVSGDGGGTLITGRLTDQPALHGVLAKVRDLGLTLISVRRLDPPGTTGERTAPA